MRGFPFAGTGLPPESAYAYKPLSFVSTPSRAERGVGFRSLSEAVDATTPAIRLQLQLFDALAEFGREVIRKRTRVGLEAARRGGRTGGRLPVLTPEKLAAARAMRGPR